MRDWSTFTRRITVDAPIQTIYDAWAVPSQIERWFLRAAEYVGFDGKQKDRDMAVAEGDAYLWRWHGYLDDVNESGIIEDANGTDRFAFTFTQNCLVTVTIKSESGETVVELTQSRIPEDENHSIYVDCSYGWTFFLANLKSVLEGGLDLRNRNVDIQNVVNA
ncbi:MAG: SRPBCC domain-containing protein [Pyrinomonadaceae bacterium]|nr:SRPBCC domain-containing protein [Pyrinomonadaceae bacterium]